MFMILQERIYIPVL